MNVFWRTEEDGDLTVNSLRFKASTMNLNSIDNDYSQNHVYKKFLTMLICIMKRDD